jgi:hypothetical protein
MCRIRSTAALTYQEATEEGQRDVQRFRGGLISQAHELWFHSILGLRFKTKKKKKNKDARVRLLNNQVDSHLEAYALPLLFKAYRLSYHSTLGLRVI